MIYTVDGNPPQLERGATNTLANPAPLGLMGFGMTTVLLNLHNSGLFPIDTMILAMGIFYGGLAQIIAGVFEFRKGNTFGMTAFCSFGLFWLSLVAILVLPNLGWGIAPNAASMTAYLCMWGLFTFLMFFGTLRTNGMLMFVFLSLAALFFLLSAAYASGSPLLHQIAGYVGVVCGLSAVYLSIAEVINEGHGRAIFPTFPRIRT